MNRLQMVLDVDVLYSFLAASMGAKVVTTKRLGTSTVESLSLTR